MSTFERTKEAVVVNMYSKTFSSNASKICYQIVDNLELNIYGALSQQFQCWLIIYCVLLYLLTNATLQLSTAHSVQDIR